MSKRYRRFFIITLALLVGIGFFREMGVIDFHKFIAETTIDSGPWHRKYAYDMPEQIQLIYKDEIVYSEGIEHGSGILKIRIDDYNIRWSAGHFMPFYKTGTNKMFVRLQIILPENKDGGTDLIGFTYKTTVKGICSSRYYRQSIIDDINKKIVQGIKRQLVKRG